MRYLVEAVPMVGDLPVTVEPLGLRICVTEADARELAERLRTSPLRFRHWSDGGQRWRGIRVRTIE